MRVAIYIRVSTTKQAVEGYSLDAQKKTLCDYCKSHKCQIYKIYADEGISGKDIAHRVAFKQLLSDSEQNLFDAVLVWKLTRFTRSLKDLITVCDKLEKYDVSLVSYSESFDTSTPSGRMMRNLLGVIAQWEREIISENVKLAITEKVEQGYHVCARVIGYDNIDKSLVVNKHESTLVKRIFSDYVKYQNLSLIAYDLNHAGYRGKNGGRFTPQSVLTILTNPIYCGFNRHYKKLYKGTHTAIISVDSFNAVQTYSCRQSPRTHKTS